MSQTSRPLAYVHSCTAVLRNENIDTDRIIPARFLTTTERTGLGKHCFEDWRYAADGSDDPAFPLNQPNARGCAILVAGHNFGCGSSREHAPWALLDYGIQAVISSEIADIFRGNSLKNGLLAIVVSPAEHRWLLDNPGIELRIDIADGSIRLPDGGTIRFDLDAFSRHCLLNGVDQMGFLLRQEAAIDTFEHRMEEAA
ncbi:MAG TPA: 3-isopropylmalate dehydratase small subunit [Luteibacter sp.]|uniref:3-isopropylmalate dehydratase small subunit n=1 Tax=Luteibacter sp. TaxID=1886636 RepID=UPI002C5EC446|nr:3-isopropylmalate dehydratase small subunit [Luteibacter sp.]HVI56840.1 3-isopropylmalate dehydratase small subunit [Luteibacter sp.]